ncbi:hypothetical protein GCG54_00015208 [Colletotrichum gloeosporioides]|uniref:Uncharacterized protein n=1 Tax=Colletotrichum gloeosporioides TaxID=474922 RepID=A0A8H4CDL2_COLGL|nr:uncharacterized protein GCG54_00015208 [Colletotrichum gloeosporioides]KAF3801985.1 hypothetical protein GCG54_00015208 [Colletotrichum gloeosporioides]
MSNLTSLDYLGILIIGAFLLVTTLLICAELIDSFTETSCPSIPCRQRAQNLHHLLRWLRVFPDSNPGIGDRALRFITDAALPQGVALLALVAWGTHLALDREVPSRWFCYLVDILAACLVLQWALLVVDHRARARRERALAAANAGKIESMNEKIVADHKARDRKERARDRKERSAAAASATIARYYPMGMGLFGHGTGDLKEGYPFAPVCS